MDAVELQKRYQAGERDFTGVDLAGANLADLVLNDANFD